MDIAENRLRFFLVSEVGDDVLANFDCGVCELNDFLRNDAKSYAEHSITSTTVVFLQDDLSSPVAFFSMSGDKVELRGTQSQDLGLPFKPNFSGFPSVRITKLAVASNMQSQGLGGTIVSMAEGLVFADSRPFSVRLLTVDALNNSGTLNFYKRVGFIELNRDTRARRGSKPSRSVPMYKDIYAEDWPPPD